jgi:hypothetical protein
LASRWSFGEEEREVKGLNVELRGVAGGSGGNYRRSATIDSGDLPKVPAGIFASHGRRLAIESELVAVIASRSAAITDRDFL